jgi:hypothetical protein
MALMSKMTRTKQRLLSGNREASDAPISGFQTSIGMMRSATEALRESGVEEASRFSQNAHARSVQRILKTKHRR